MRQRLSSKMRDHGSILGEHSSLRQLSLFKHTVCFILLPINHLSLRSVYFSLAVRPALASASSRLIVRCAPLQMRRRRLIIFHVSMAEM